MYIAFVKHGVLPSAYFTASPSEKLIIRAFLSQEHEEEKKQAEEIKRRH